MTDYTLYYWPIRFAASSSAPVLAHVGADWQEAGIEDLVAQKDEAPPISFAHIWGHPCSRIMRRSLAGAMPAILTYLGRKHGLIADDPAARR